MKLRLSDQGSVLDLTHNKLTAYLTIHTRELLQLRQDVFDNLRGTTWESIRQKVYFYAATPKDIP